MAVFFSSLSQTAVQLTVDLKLVFLEDIELSFLFNTKNYISPRKEWQRAYIWLFCPRYVKKSDQIIYLTALQQILKSF